MKVIILLLAVMLAGCNHNNPPIKTSRLHIYAPTNSLTEPAEQGEIFKTEIVNPYCKSSFDGWKMVVECVGCDINKEETIKTLAKQGKICEVFGSHFWEYSDNPFEAKWTIPDKTANEYPADRTCFYNTFNRTCKICGLKEKWTEKWEAE